MVRWSYKRLARLPLVRHQFGPTGDRSGLPGTSSAAARGRIGRASHPVPINLQQRVECRCGLDEPARRLCESTASEGGLGARRSPRVGGSVLGDHTRACCVLVLHVKNRMHGPRARLRPLDLENATWIAFIRRRFRCASEGRCLVGGATPTPCDTGPGRCMNGQTQADFCEGTSCRYTVSYRRCAYHNRRFTTQFDARSRSK
jgi:hypothetical protein